MMILTLWCCILTITILVTAMVTIINDIIIFTVDLVCASHLLNVVHQSAHKLSKDPAGQRVKCGSEGHAADQKQDVSCSEVYWRTRTVNREMSVPVTLADAEGSAFFWHLMALVVCFYNMDILESNIDVELFILLNKVRENLISFIISVILRQSLCYVVSFYFGKSQFT